MSAIAERKSHVGTFLLGLLLLLFGALLLMSRAGVVDLNFTRVAAFAVLMVGGFESITAFAGSNRRRLFWGSILFLSAMLVLLVSYGYIPDSWGQIWPSALIIPGLAFLMLFFSNPKEYSLLLVAVLFVAVGWSLLLAQKGEYIFGEGIFGTLRFLVPVAIVAAGVYIIWKNFFGKHL
jgi:hypothetical protein